MRRKAAYCLLSVAFLLLVSIWFLSNHTWRGEIWDGYGDSEKGVSVALKTWNSMDGKARVEESIHTYTSLETARRDFQEALKGPGVILEITSPQDSASEDQERAIKLMGDRETREGAVQIIRRDKNRIHYLDAGSLKIALAYETSLFKLNF